MNRLTPAVVLTLASPLLLSSAGCTALATTPEWVGGGLAVEAPARAALDLEREEREHKLRASQPSQVGARHLLVMHIDSLGKPDSVTRSREEARKRAQEALLKIRGGANFDQVVREYTDEPGGAERNGDLGVFDRGTMVKAFSDAAFALKVGEVSEIVETKYGFHVLKRTE